MTDIALWSGFIPFSTGMKQAFFLTLWTEISLLNHCLECKFYELKLDVPSSSSFPTPPPGSPVMWHNVLCIKREQTLQRADHPTNLSIFQGRLRTAMEGKLRPSRHLFQECNLCNFCLAFGSCLLTACLVSIRQKQKHHISDLDESLDSISSKRFYARRWQTFKGRSSTALISDLFEERQNFTMEGVWVFFCNPVKGSDKCL